MLANVGTNDTEMPAKTSRAPIICFGKYLLFRTNLLRTMVKRMLLLPRMAVSGPGTRERKAEYTASIPLE